MADDIDPTDADIWPTLSLEGWEAEDRFWKAGFVDGAIEDCVEREERPAT
jgi:hypothetical protein